MLHYDSWWIDLAIFPLSKKTNTDNIETNTYKELAATDDVEEQKQDANIAENLSGHYSYNVVFKLFYDIYYWILGQ